MPPPKVRTGARKPGRAHRPRRGDRITEGKGVPTKGNDAITKGKDALTEGKGVPTKGKERGAEAWAGPQASARRPRNSRTEAEWTGRPPGQHGPR